MARRIGYGPSAFSSTTIASQQTIVGFRVPVFYCQQVSTCVMQPPSTPSHHLPWCRSAVASVQPDGPCTRAHGHTGPGPKFPPGRRRRSPSHHRPRSRRRRTLLCFTHTLSLSLQHPFGNNFAWHHHQRLAPVILSHPFSRPRPPVDTILLCRGPRISHSRPCPFFGIRHPQRTVTQHDGRSHKVHLPCPPLCPCRLPITRPRYTPHEHRRRARHELDAHPPHPRRRPAKVTS